MPERLSAVYNTTRTPPVSYHGAKYALVWAAAIGASGLFFFFFAESTVFVFCLVFFSPFGHLLQDLWRPRGVVIYKSVCVCFFFPPHSING